MQNTTAQFKKQLPRNAFFQFLSFFQNLIIGVWFVPFIISNLGSAAYGLIPIAAIITEYVSIINQSISGAVNRFLTIAIQNNNLNEASRIFNTSFFSYLTLAIIQIPIFYVVINNINAILSIPEVLYKDAILLLICNATAFLFNLATSVYSVPLYANNRLDLTRAIEITAQLMRLVGIFSCFILFQPRLRYIGYVDLIVKVMAAIVTVVIGKLEFPALKINIRYFDWCKIRQLTLMGGWIAINYIGFLLLLRIDIWVCNRFIGAEAAGKYAALLPWSNFLRQGALLLAGIINPMIMIYYSRSEINNIIKLNVFCVKLLSLLFSIPICIICVFSSPILSLWLGKQYANLAPLLVIMNIHLFVNLGVLPLFSIQTALHRVKIPALIQIGIGIINVLLAIVLVRCVGWGIYGVAAASTIVLTIKNALFTPIYTAKILKQPWDVFIKPYLHSFLFFSSIMTLGCVINKLFLPKTWLHLMILSGFIGSVGIIFMLLLLSKRDRKTILVMVPASIQTYLFKLLGFKNE